jgi:hypothetical protein
MLSIKARMSSTLQAVTRLFNFTAGGYFPDLTPRHHVAGLTGMIAGIGGFAFLSPMIMVKRTNPVSGRRVGCSVFIMEFPNMF